MRYCVYGLGAIGGQLAARLTAAGVEVVGVAREGACKVVREHGFVLEAPDGSTTSVQVEVATSASALPRADVVVLAVKSTALPAVVADLERAVGPDTVVVTAMNGLPWWFADGLDLATPSIRSALDDRLGQMVPPAQVLGCAVHHSARVAAPGHVVRTSGNGLALGPVRPDGVAASAAEGVVSDLRAATYDVEQTDQIHRAVWYKLWGNLTLNPVSLITRSPVDHVLGDPDACAFVEACMSEAQRVGDVLGLPIPSTPAERLGMTRRLGSFTTSMHQDAVAGRPVELDSILGETVRLARAAGVATPGLDALLGLARLHARAHDLLPTS